MKELITENKWIVSAIENNNERDLLKNLYFESLR